MIARRYDCEDEPGEEECSKRSNATATPTVKNIVVKNVHFNGLQRHLAIIEGLPESPFQVWTPVLVVRSSEVLEFLRVSDMLQGRQNGSITLGSKVHNEQRVNIAAIWVKSQLPITWGG